MLRMPRLVAILTFLFLALAVVPADPAAVAVSITTALLLGLVALKAASLAHAAGDSPGVGRRARAHRQLLESTPEPQHPDTAGRPRTRAPGFATAAA